MDCQAKNGIIMCHCHVELPLVTWDSHEDLSQLPDRHPDITWPGSRGLVLSGAWLRWDCCTASDMFGSWDQQLKRYWTRWNIFELIFQSTYCLDLHIYIYIYTHIYIYRCLPDVADVSADRRRPGRTKLAATSLGLKHLNRRNISDPYTYIASIDFKYKNPNSDPVLGGYHFVWKPLLRPFWALPCCWVSICCWVRCLYIYIYPL